MKKENNHNSKYRILSITFGILFILTLLLFIAYAVDKKDDFGDGWNASYTYQQAQDYFLGDDDPHTTKITRNDGSEVSLYPDTYSVYAKTSDNSRATLGSVEKLLPFSETTNQNIVGLSYYGDYGDKEIAFIDPNKLIFVHLNDKAYNVPNIVEFNSIDPYINVSYSITTNIPENECADVYTSEAVQQLDLPEYFQGVVNECNKTGDVYLTHLLVNDEVAYSFSPIRLERQSGGLEAPIGYSPSTWIHLRGVSPELDKAYFEFRDSYLIDDEGNWLLVEFPLGAFSIDLEGNIETTELPDDMVTIIYE